MNKDQKEARMGPIKKKDQKILELFKDESEFFPIFTCTPCRTRQDKNYMRVSHTFLILVTASSTQQIFLVLSQSFILIIILPRIDTNVTRSEFRSKSLQLNFFAPFKDADQKLFCKFLLLFAMQVATTTTCNPRGEKGGPVI